MEKSLKCQKEHLFFYVLHFNEYNHFMYNFDMTQKVIFCPNSYFSTNVWKALKYQLRSVLGWKVLRKVLAFKQLMTILKLAATLYVSNSIFFIFQLSTILTISGTHVYYLYIGM